MDCIYCGILKQIKIQNEILETDHFFEYTVCLYDNYMAKLFNSICQVHELEKEMKNIWDEYTSLQCQIKTDPDFCHGENENDFVDGNCCNQVTYISTRISRYTVYHIHVYIITQQYTDIQRL